MTKFTEDVISIIKNIPCGKVMSYGQIAKAAGSPKAARQVVRILHTMTGKYDLPWHRVVNSKLEISVKDPEFFDEQRHMLIVEGIEVNFRGRIDKAYQIEIS